MKLKLAALACNFVLMMSVMRVAAQPYRQLRPDDFQGVPHPQSGAIAYTNCTIDFKYEASRRNGYYLLNCNIQLVMNHYKSWMDRAHITSAQMMTEVLKHEQGHYIIAYLEQQELMREIQHTQFGADYRSQAMDLFNRVDAKYRQLNHDYDDDTGHMLNRTQQTSWDNWFQKRLAYMPPLNDRDSR